MKLTSPASLKPFAPIALALGLATAVVFAPYVIAYVAHRNTAQVTVIGVHDKVQAYRVEARGYIYVFHVEGKTYLKDAKGVFLELK